LRNKVFGKKKEEGTSDGKKEEKKGRRGKARDKTKTALKRVGGGILGALGISAVVKNRPSITEWRNNLRGKNNPNGNETGVYGGILETQNAVE
jgi:hypothetical protein